MDEKSNYNGQCPSPGLCLALSDRVMKLEIQGVEKDKGSAFARSIALTLLGITVVHFGAFLVWVGSSNEKFAQIQSSDRWQTDVIRELQKGKP